MKERKLKALRLMTLSAFIIAINSQLPATNIFEAGQKFFSIIHNRLPGLQMKEVVMYTSLDEIMDQFTGNNCC